MHAKESHTRYSIDRYYRLKLEVPQIIENIKDIDFQLLASGLCEHSEEVLQDGVQAGECEGRHNLAVEGRGDRPHLRDPTETGVLRERGE